MENNNNSAYYSIINRNIDDDLKIKIRYKKKPKGNIKNAYNICRKYFTTRKILSR